MSRILLMLLLLSALPTGAQDSGPAGAGSNGEEPGSEEGDAVGAGSTGDESRSQTAPTEGDPFDYQSSERISEDLSVSFPVDI